jgi:ABC-type microcin C transport system permease subunit YejB
MLLYIIIYMGFIVSFPLGDDTATDSSRRTILWTGIIILVTFGIIAVYAI